MIQCVVRVCHRQLILSVYMSVTVYVSVILCCVFGIWHINITDTTATSSKNFIGHRCCFWKQKVPVLIFNTATELTRLRLICVQCDKVAITLCRHVQSQKHWHTPLACCKPWRCKKRLINLQLRCCARQANLALILNVYFAL